MLPRSRKARLILGAALLGLPLLVGGWWWIVAHSIDADLERIRGEGMPVTLEDLRPPAAPEGMVDAGPHYAAAARAITSEGAPEDEREQLGVFWEHIRSGNSAAIKIEELAAVRGALERNAEALAHLDRATAIGFCRPVVGMFPDAELSGGEVGRVMHVANVARWRTSLRLYEGDGDGAAQSALAILRLPRAFGKNTILMHLVQVAIRHMGAENAADVLGADVTNEHLQQLDAELRRLDEPAAFREALIGERVMGLAMMGITPGGQSLPGYMGGALPGFTRRMMARTYLDYIGKGVDAAGLPCPQSLDELGTIRARGLYKGMVDGQFSRPAVLTARSLAMVRAARLAIACERYRREHGQSPESLVELAPKYIDAIPIDPFDGRALKYKRDGGAILIYSVDDNRTDDGGDYERKGDKDSPDVGLRVVLPRR